MHLVIQLYLVEMPDLTAVYLHGVHALQLDPNFAVMHAQSHCFGAPHHRACCLPCACSYRRPACTACVMWLSHTWQASAPMPYAACCR
jgi:hypothetical protein